MKYFHSHDSHEQMHHGDTYYIARQLIEKLRLAGERLTPARIAVLEVLSEQVDHLSAEDLASLVSLRDPDIHRATVYRTLDLFDELGLLSRLPGPTGGNLYHLYTPDEHHSHLHVQCRKCTKVTHVPEEAFDSVLQELASTIKFEPTYSALIGVCLDCQLMSK